MPFKSSTAPLVTLTPPALVPSAAVLLIFNVPAEMVVRPV